MATVTIVFRKDKFNRKGKAPINFRIIKNRKTSYIASGIMITPEHWDEEKKKVKSNHRNSGRLNSFLANKYAEIQDTVLEYETISKSMSSRNLRDKVFGKKPAVFFAFADGVVEKYRHEGKIYTYHKSKSVITKLKHFQPAKTTLFNDITQEFLANYEQHLREVYHNKTNTINKDMKFIRKVFNDAIRQDIISYEASPFRKYQMRLEKTHRSYLTEDELDLIDKYPATTTSRIELHRDMFVFAAWTGGIRISDMLQLKWKDFDGTHVNIVTKKTGVQVSIKVTNKGLEILNKYQSATIRKESFIFPMLNETLNLNDPEKVYAALSSASAYVNKNLKIIATSVGIEKNLSFHISRHSFAVRALRKGISIDKVSKLMAHSSIRETQVYAKVVNEDLDKAMDAFNS